MSPMALGRFGAAWWLAAPAILLASGACVDVASLETAIPDSLMVADARLPGAWMCRTEGDSSAFVVQGAGTEGFVVGQLGDTQPVGPFFSGRFGRLGRYWILELVGDASVDDSAKRFGAILLRRQVFLDFQDSTLQVSILDGERLIRALRADTTLFSHRIRDEDQVLLLDRTPQLGPAIVAYARRPGALEPHGQCRRTRFTDANRRLVGVWRLSWSIAYRACPWPNRCTDVSERYVDASLAVLQSGTAAVGSVAGGSSFRCDTCAGQPIGDRGRNTLTITGDSVSWVDERAGAFYRFAGRVTGEVMHGSLVIVPRGRATPYQGTGTWTAHRVP